MIKCSDFFIIKIYLIPSEYCLKKFLKGDDKAHLKMIKCAQDYLDFFWKFFHHVTGITREEFQIEYFSAAYESAMEELNEKKGIFIATNSPHYKYHIPIKDVNTIEWVKQNVQKLPHKILKKTYITYLDYLLKNPTTVRREMSKTPADIKEKLMNKKQNHD